MIEFSGNFRERFEGTSAIPHRVLYRLSVRKGEVPYFGRGLDIQEFSYTNDVSSAVRAVLSDFKVPVLVLNDSVRVGDVLVQIPEGLF